MKHFYILLTAIFFSLNIQAQLTPFITTWEVTAGDLDITIPTEGTGYDYTIDFGDGTVQNNVTGDVTHTYTAPGVYTVAISGDFPRIRFGNFYEPNTMLHKIKSVEQWGDIEWLSMESAFGGCSSLIINATDAPDLDQVTDLSHMFNDAESFNQNIDNWDVSNVTSMEGMFSKTSFNQPLDSWDVSSVTNMNRLFMYNDAFDQPLNSWDVSNVTDMGYMFHTAESFNQPLDNWNVSNVTNMGFMFHRAQSFNQNIDNWDVSNVTQMNRMFQLASSFNQPLDNWDVSNVTSMGAMFNQATSFNQPLNNWDVSNVTYIGDMFRNTQFNQPLNNWDVSSVLTMGGVFENALAFNQPLDNWDVSSVTNMGAMFQNAQSFNQDLSNWPLNHTGFNYFLSNSGVDRHNYDIFLTHLATLNLNSGTLGADNLEYCNSGARDYLINQLGWTINEDNVYTDCNLITGDVLYDQNNDGCDPSDIGVEGFMINAFDGTNDWITSSNNGTYDLGVFGTDFTVSVVNQPSYFTVTPASVPVTFTSSTTEIVDFCVTANLTVEDLNITLLPTSEARPGYEADYRLVVKNVGTETLANVEATLAFDDVMQEFVSASPTPGTTTASSLTFTIGTMEPFETFETDLTMLTFEPPTVNGGDILSFTTEVTPVTNDYTPNDNEYDLDQVVVNSYDPNDKQVLQGEELHIDEADEYLDYLIRFQNTGTASAINVRILDTLHPQLDWSTLTPISASHDYYVNITEGNRVEFMFDDINLPHEGDDEPASHGFVAFKIKPKSGVQVGDIISGDARIYFDFNPPIITNMVQTEFVDPLGIPDVSSPLNQIVLYPNPVDHTLHIHRTEGIELEKTRIYDLQGREVKKVEGNQTSFDVEHLSPGVYFLKITTNQGTVNRQMIKKGTN